MAKKGEKVIHSAETRKKISEQVKLAYSQGRLIHWSKKGSYKPKGFQKKHSEETKAKISESRKGKGLGNTHAAGHIPWNKGKSHRVHNAEWRAKVSAANSGPNHWNWKGGIASENSRMRNSSLRKDWTKAVFKRDHFTCKKCNRHGQKTEMVAHHIIPWSKSIDLRFDVSNGITLCRPCHCAFHKPRTGTGKSPMRQLI